MTENSDKEHVVLKSGEETKEIRYLQDGVLYIYCEKPTEIIGSEDLKTFSRVSLMDCVWDDDKEVKFSIPNTVNTLDINESLITIPNFLENFPHLKTFGISQSIGFNLEHLRNMKFLKRIIFMWSDIKKIEHLSDHPNLEELNLSSNKISRIEGLENLEQLTVLDLSYNQIEKIESIDHLTNLRELYLGNNQIRKIEGLNNLKNLKILDLDQNPITKLEGLENLINLEEIIIRSPNFPRKKFSREELAPYFANLKNLSRVNGEKYPEADMYSLRGELY